MPPRACNTPRRRMTALTVDAMRRPAGGEGRRGKLTASKSYYRMNGAMTPGWKVSHVPS